ncbi:MAG: FHA domain-containing serine/threonine-protein kinase [Anaerolineae bacterium]|nr:FHA domain-containing serine/threonine-protein kinase [Anaerolineae bacterium]
MDNSDNLIGKSLGKYTLQEYLGFGAMARVFKAYHANLDRYVAIKLLHAHFAADEEFVVQFITEAKNLASLRHPNIVQVYDFDIENGMPYMVMEYIDGATLKKVVEDAHKHYQRIPIEKCVRIVQNIGVALSYAHHRQIAHRDVKPSNVMIESTGRVVLADFGLARLLSGKKNTITGTLKGTPAYMSPEQGMGLSSTGRSDIYSLGVILFELSTGQLPYNAENPLAIAMKHINDPLPAPSSIFPEIPEKIEKIIFRAMAKRPEDRYQSVDDMLEDLKIVNRSKKTGRLPSASLTEITSVDKNKATSLAPTMSLEEDPNPVSLHFVDTGQILYLKSDGEYTIGRAHKQQAVIPDIDLSPFNAYQWGISRLHAKVNLNNKKVEIMDLGSSNGTWQSGKKLKPNRAYELKHGDVVMLGQLKIQVLIYE